MTEEWGEPVLLPVILSEAKNPFPQSKITLAEKRDILGEKQ
jgi:hypothetical protein